MQVAAIYIAIFDDIAIFEDSINSSKSFDKYISLIT